jgi:hypothetical protein
MECYKCNKIIKKGEILTMDKCSKCSSLCNFETCKKKSFKNGFCHCHVINGTPLKLMMATKSVTKEDLLRREVNRIKIDNFDREIITRREQILQIRSDSKCEESIKIRRIIFMEEELKEFINSYKYNLDDEIEKLRNYYNEIPCFSYGKSRGPNTNKYTNWKKDKFKDKKQKTKGSGKSDSKDNSSTDDSSEDEEIHLSQFESLVKDAFEMFEIPKTSDLSLIKKAYYKRAKDIHPDRHVNNVDGINYLELFQELGTAYEFIIKNIERI